MKSRDIEEQIAKRHAWQRMIKITHSSKLSYRCVMKVECGFHVKTYSHFCMNLIQSPGRISTIAHFTSLDRSLSNQCKLEWNKNKDRLLPLFSSFFEKFSNATITEVYTSLFDRMVNLRKKEMEKSWERLDTHKNVTLNLRDELKPFVAKRK